jgi:hypothetical protein
MSKKDKIIFWVGGSIFMTLLITWCVLTRPDIGREKFYHERLMYLNPDSLDKNDTTQKNPS